MAVKVSVILPVYNAEKHLAQCLESLLAQTLQDIEIICVDDGSTDGSEQILQKYHIRDDRVHVIRQENAGAGAARNKGMQYATGKYYAFPDADDFYETNMLEKAYETAKKNSAQIVVYGCNYYESEKNRFRACHTSIRKELLPPFQPFSLLDARQDVFKMFVGWAWDKLFDAQFIKDHHLVFQEQRTTNDLLFVFSALVCAQRIAVFPKVLVHYRQEKGSLSVTREKSWGCFYAALLGLRERLKKENLYNQFERDYINYCVHFSLWNLNTLKEPAHTQLYEKLRNEWFEELDLVRWPMDYFYNRKEYLDFRNVYEHPIDWIPSKEQRYQQARLQEHTMLYRGLLCVRENGLNYTLHNIMHKVKVMLKRKNR